MEMLIDRDLAGAKWARVAGLGDGRRDQAQAALFRLEFRLEGPVQRPSCAYPPRTAIACM